MIEVTLPWPPPRLNPNARTHWGKRARAAKRYKLDCGWACRAAGVRPLAVARAAVAVTFHPPDKQRRDLDNMLAAIKAGLDAISAAIGVDDSLFELAVARGEPRTGGEVVVRVTEAAAPAPTITEVPAS